MKERLKTEMEEKEVEVKRLLESVQVLVSYSQIMRGDLIYICTCF